MKFKKFLTAAICAFALIAPANTNAEINIFKALSAAQKGLQAATITDSQMASYVRQSVEQMDKKNSVLPASSPYSKRLARLTANVKDADGIPLNFKVYQIKEINAFACPDGSVRVYTGLMDIMTDDELMGVIGHEIGHVLKRHSKKALKHQLLTGALFDVAGAASSTIATLTDSQLGAIGESLISAKYSRSQENEADDAGYDFLVANNLNPWGMAMAFEKLSQDESNSRSSYILNMFSSHPETKKRIKRMTDRAKKDGYERPSN